MLLFADGVNTSNANTLSHSFLRLNKCGVRGSILLDFPITCWYKKAVLIVCWWWHF